MRTAFAFVEMRKDAVGIGLLSHLSGARIELTPPGIGHDLARSLELHAPGFARHIGLVKLAIGIKCRDKPLCNKVIELTFITDEHLRQVYDMDVCGWMRTLYEGWTEETT